MPFLVLLLLLASLPAFGSGEHCESPLQSSSVQVVFEPPAPLVVDESLGWKDLTANARLGSAFVGPSHDVLGLSLVSPQALFSYRLSKVKSLLYPGKDCVRLELFLSLRLDSPTIRLAKELPANSCLRKEVLAHENEHS